MREKVLLVRDDDDQVISVYVDAQGQVQRELPQLSPLPDDRDSVSDEEEEEDTAGDEVKNVLVLEEHSQDQFVDRYEGETEDDQVTRVLESDVEEEEEDEDYVPGEDEEDDEDEEEDETEFESGSEEGEIVEEE